MHPAMRVCLSNLGFADSSEPPAVGFPAADALAARRGGGSGVDVAAMFALAGGGAPAQGSPAAGGGGGGGGARAAPDLSHLKQVWQSVSDLRGACINRVLDCEPGGPLGAHAADAITRHFSDPSHLPRPKLDLSTVVVS